MRLPGPLLPARLVRRYKRFLADVVLDDGSEAVAHCADPGRLPGLAVPGARVWLSHSDDPKRKLAHRLEIIEQDGRLVALNVMNANRIVREALEGGKLPALGPFDHVRPEPRIEAGTRLDFALEREGGLATFVEVKNITWRRDAGAPQGPEGEAAFPDAVTTRGARHLACLAGLAALGHRAVLLFIAQRGDVDRVAIAGDIDPAYASAFAAARAAGVEMMAWRCSINHDEICLDKNVPVV